MEEGGGDGGGGGKTVVMVGGEGAKDGSSLKMKNGEVMLEEWVE
jgi:hypothetical protein